MAKDESNSTSAPRDERVVTFGGAREDEAPAGDSALADAAEAATEDSREESGSPDEAAPSSKRRALRWGAVIGAAAVVAAVAVGIALAQGGAPSSGADSAEVPFAAAQAADERREAEPSESTTDEKSEQANEQAADSSGSAAAGAAGSAQGNVAQGAADAGAGANDGSAGATPGGVRPGAHAAGGASGSSAPSGEGASGGAPSESSGVVPSDSQQPESPQVPPAEEPAVQTVTVQVDSSSVGGGVSFEGTVEYREGMTVFDVLVETGLPYNAESSAFGVYVSAVGGLAEKDHGSQSGWKYSVNGEVVMVSASACTVQPGDVVKWFYTTVG